MQIVWFRNDLRLQDHPALVRACETGEPVTAVYCVTPGQWRAHDEAPVKLGLRQAALQTLQQQLAKLGIALELLEADIYADLPQLLLACCERLHAKRLWFNEEYPLHEQRRDDDVRAALQDAGIIVKACLADALVSRHLLSQRGDPYKVFTPWYRRWLQQLSEELPQPLPAPEQPVAKPLKQSELLKIELPGASGYREDIWPADAEAVSKRLHGFLHNQQAGYSKRRNYPSVRGTSLISPYLASGLVSVRQCLAAIQQQAAQEGRDWRESDWLRELAWRQFYRYLMRAFPALSRGAPFKAETATLQWEFDEARHEAWCQGKTGFPLVDAGMRQLVDTGWMHNRLRMLTASFYVKLMLHDWHRGEQFFMQQLIDGDFPSNNGGWQWSASTGCDASPWFRIFNPYRQSERFDPDGSFIRKLVPELADVEGKEIHNPHADTRERCGYPEPIIDYKVARERALERFRAH